jgi:precorrin-2 dehydrogenase/sirohydrochlorin ferrochelatase
VIPTRRRRPKGDADSPRSATQRLFPSYREGRHADTGQLRSRAPAEIRADPVQATLAAVAVVFAVAALALAPALIVRAASLAALIHSRCARTTEAHSAALPTQPATMASDAVDTSAFSGGSLLLAWQLKDKHVLLVGGGDVASGRIESVLVADARITLVCPSDGLHPLTRRLLAACPDRITHHDRLFEESDLAGVDMALTAIDDTDASRAICALCRAARIPVNVADVPPSCDFYFGSQVRDGPLQVLISTNGQSPKLANLIRRRIEAAIPPNAGAAIEKVGSLRQKLRARAPGVGGALGKRRMRWMIDVCTAWDMEELAALDEDMMVRLLDEGWEKDRVPPPRELGAPSHADLAHANKLLSNGLPVAGGFLAGAACAVVGMMIWARQQR